MKNTDFSLKGRFRLGLLTICNKPLSKTFKDKPEKYLSKEGKRQKPKEKRFESSKGRKQENIKKNLEDYFI